MTTKERIQMIKTISVRVRAARIKRDEDKPVETEKGGQGINFGAFKDKLCKWCGTEFRGSGPFCSDVCRENNTSTWRQSKQSKQAKNAKRKKEEENLRRDTKPHLGRDHSERKVKRYLIQLPDTEFSTREASVLWGKSMRYSLSLISEMHECGLVAKWRNRAWWIKTPRGRMTE